MIGKDITPDWVDQVVVDRALAGKPVGRTLHRAEKLAVARQLLADGYGVNALMATAHLNGTDAARLVKEAKACSG